MAVFSITLTAPGFSEPLDVAPGQDPGGTAIAIVTQPFQLKGQSISQSLARDGEGVAIGWDFSNRPKTSHNTTRSQNQSKVPAVVATLAAHTGVRLIPAFVDPLRPATWAQAVAFVARTPARIVAVPFATHTETDWIAFRAAAEHFSDLLFVVPAHSPNTVAQTQDQSSTGLSYPAAFHLANVLSIGVEGGTQSDIQVMIDAQAQTPETGVALAVKALLFCPSPLKTTGPGLTKSQALAKLSALKTSEPSGAPTSGSLVVTPCAEALN